MVEAARKKPAASTGRNKSSQPVVQGLRGRIPSMQPAQADALRYFFAAPERWLLRDGGVLRFSSATPHAAGDWFELEADGVALGLRLDAGHATPPEALHWSDYTGRARMLAWALAHEPQLIRLSDALGVSLLPVGKAEPPDNAESRDPDIRLAFAIEDGDVATTRGTLRLPASWVDRLLDRAEQVYDDDPLPDLGEWRRLPAPVSIRVPGPRLQGDDWRALRPGDVIVVGSRSQALRAEAHASGHHWPLAGGPEGWRIDGPARSHSVLQESSAMNENESPNAETHDTGSGLDMHAHNLPVNIEFDLGRVEMSVGELAALQPGYVFALPAHLEGANVTIRANGRVSGRGEMVAVGDTLGVRLLSWS